MEKYIYNEQNGLWYELQGDYYIPCLVLEEEDTQPIGMWGRRYLRCIKEHRPVLHRPSRRTKKPFPYSPIPRRNRYGGQHGLHAQRL